MLLYSRNQHNIVKKLYSNFNKKRNLNSESQPGGQPLRRTIQLVLDSDAY